MPFCFIAMPSWGYSLPGRRGGLASPVPPRTPPSVLLPPPPPLRARVCTCVSPGEHFTFEFELF